MKKYILLLSMYFCLNPLVFSQYQFNDNCKTAWVLLMDLKIEEAKQLTAKELKINPENYYALYLDQTCDAYALYINSSKKEIETFLEHYDKKKKMMDGKYEDSPYYLMCTSEMDLQAGLFKVLNGSILGGVRNIYTGYKKVHKNIDLYPDFYPSLMMDGFFNCALSNLPPFVRSAVSLFSVSSDFDKGWAMLNEVFNNQKDIRGINAESALYLIFVAKINKTPGMVYDFTQSYEENIGDLFLPKFFKANIEYRTGRNEQALKTLSGLDPHNSPYAEFLYDYMMGKALLRKLDDRSGDYIKKALKSLRKKDYYREMTYLLALYNLIGGDRNRYDELCRLVRENGSDIIERDHEALYDASLDYEPDVHLVKARLLLDGGYITRFEQIIHNYETHPREELPYRLEYHFLKGRYDLATGDTLASVTDFKWVIGKGRNADYYFASEAALRLGNIYEKEGRFDRAKEFYKLSVDLYKSGYYEYIENKAEKALRHIDLLTK